MSRKTFLLVLLIPFYGWARSPAGILEVIITPNDGVPTVTLPGSSFEVLSKQRGELALLNNEQRFSLETEWREMPGGLFRADCSLPSNIPNGIYSLECVLPDKRDMNHRAVCVIDAFPEEYSIIHLTDIHIGSNRHPKPSEQIFHELINSIRETCRTIEETWKNTYIDTGLFPPTSGQEAVPRVSFVVLTGDLTEGGEPEQFRSFLGLLDGFDLPTFVCAGNHDRKGLHYEEFFGPLAYHFRFGSDGYLIFDTKDYLIGDEAGPQDGLLQYFRETLMPCRWSIGLTHRYDPTMSMRTQLTLFVDNPLDFLLYGHVHRENKPEEQRVPWGTTSTIITPAAIDGAYRIISVYRNRVLAQPSRSPVSVR